MAEDSVVAASPTITSFRDPGGQLTDTGSRILRTVKPVAVDDLLAFLQSSTAQRAIADRRLVQSAIQPQPDTSGDLLVEHERIAFPSYPGEWSTGMLAAAGHLTLDLAEAALADGFGLKDAAPQNVLFAGTRPVFVDLLSFERRTPGDAIWLPYDQFVRCFLRPLAVNRQFGLPLAMLYHARRDGLTAEFVYRLCSPLQRLLPPFLGLAAVPHWLGKNEATPGSGQRPPLRDPAQATYILHRLLRHLRRQLDSVRPPRATSSHWMGYMASGGNNYSSPAFQAKERFVTESLALGCTEVLDVGCNTGHFSQLAAKAGARVVAIDGDPAVVDAVWHAADQAQLNILPLVVDLCQPSPATGWHNAETRSFLDRSRGRFDLVLMLAVIHHMMVQEGIPLGEILATAAEMTRRWLVIEYVPPDDSMFRRLARGRDALYTWLTPEAFEAACRRHFRIVRHEALPESGRILYLLERHDETVTA